ncbi:MAG: hypothetical protein IPP40_13755 [bacterium]|nr:hypothetical protein [bacterium]
MTQRIHVTVDCNTRIVPDKCTVENPCIAQDIHRVAVNASIADEEAIRNVLRPGEVIKSAPWLPGCPSEWCNILFEDAAINPGAAVIYNPPNPAVRCIIAVEETIG